MIISLTQGKSTIVDDDIPQNLIMLKWQFNGYARHSVWESGKCHYVYLHRLIVDAPLGMEVDHINGNKLDNRRCNLRICLPSQNKKNSQKSPKARISKYKGVTKRYHRWEASIKTDGKTLHLGYFDTEDEAAMAYNKAAIRLFGEYANPNKINL